MSRLDTRRGPDSRDGMFGSSSVIHSRLELCPGQPRLKSGEVSTYGGNAVKFGTQSFRGVAGEARKLEVWGMVVRVRVSISETMDQNGTFSNALTFVTSIIFPSSSCDSGIIFMGWHFFFIIESESSQCDVSCDSRQQVAIYRPLLKGRTCVQKTVLLSVHLQSHG